MSDAKYEKNGFSLVEVLLVIAIVGILIAVTTPNWISSRSVELSGASLEMGAFFEQARAEARTYGEPVRVLIHDSPKDLENFRSRIIAVRRKSPATAEEEPGWRSLWNPLLLPEGVYFDASMPGTPDLRVTFQEGKNGEVSWITYEFQPDGTLSDGGQNVVVAAGVRDSSGTIQIPNPEQVAGFRVSANGRPIQFHTREEILSTASR
ncbi:MAG: hypothetical protein CMO55_07635 [Verrucomicrobiales bacterium]|nr:hypothetical protein [Verrucomicrobiales bacterium]